MARRILLLITDLEIGGTPTVVRELAIRLNDPPRVIIEVACLAGFGPVAEQLRAAGIAVTPLHARRPSDLRVVRQLIELIRTRAFDTVFSFLVHANAVAAAAKFACGGVRFLQSIQTTQATPRWHWHVQGLVHHAADLVVVPSPSVAQVAQEWAHVPPEKIVVIPNAIDPADFTPSPIPLENPRPFPIGFIGRLDPVKRVPDLLAAVAMLNATEQFVHLHVFGDGVEYPTLERQIQQQHLADSVTMHGVIPRSQDALRQIGLLVLPSISEGFGLVLIEAMAAGVPVIARDVPGVRDVVRNEQTGILVLSLDVPALAQVIARVIGDVDLRRRLIESARREVAQRFSWERVLQRYRSHI